MVISYPDNTLCICLTQITILFILYPHCAIFTDAHFCFSVAQGNQQEIEDCVATANKNQLATLSVILRKELDRKKSEARTLCTESVGLRRQLAVYRKRLTESSEATATAKEALSQLEKQIENRSQSNDYCHEDTLSAKKRQKFSLSPSSSWEMEDSVVSPVPLPVTCLRFSESSGNGGRNVEKRESAGLSDPSNLPNVSGLGNFNLFRQKVVGSSGLMGVGSAIRTGYNGLGGHTKHVEASRKPVGKPAIKGGSGKAVFGKSKFGVVSKELPRLPTLDNYLT